MSEPLNVVIVGGGVAGLETLIALHSLAGPRVRVTLVEPAPEFVYRAQSVGEPFGMEPAMRHRIETVARDFGADLVTDRLEHVAADANRVYLGGGDDLEYDALVLALGARSEPVWPHVLTFRGPRDAPAMAELVADVERGEVGSAAFVVPPGVTWPLPLYELALLTAQRAKKAGADVQLAVFTPEKEPLAVFGRDASRRVASELGDAGVLVARAATVEVTPHGDVLLPFEETPLRFERVVALPRLAGPAPRGVTHDDHGFIRIDPHGLVHDMHHVFAAGDGTDYPVKQGGIAAQQADAVAESIAKLAGAGTTPRPFTEVLRAKLITGHGDTYLRGELSDRATALSESADTPLWWPAGKIAGAYLAPYLAAAPAAERIVQPTAWIEESPYGE